MKGAKEIMTQPCEYCLNSVCDPSGELDDYNDFSSMPIGCVDRDCRMNIDSSAKHGIQIEFWRSFGIGQGNQLLGFYTPKFCPECGRELIENKNRQRVKEAQDERVTEIKGD